MSQLENLKGSSKKKRLGLPRCFFYATLTFADFQICSLAKHDLLHHFPAEFFIDHRGDFLFAVAQLFTQDGRGELYIQSTAFEDDFLRITVDAVAHEFFPGLLDIDPVHPGFEPVGFDKRFEDLAYRALIALSFGHYLSEKGVYFL